MKDIHAYSLSDLQLLQGKHYWRGWDQNLQTRSQHRGSDRVAKREVSVDYSKYDPESYLLSWFTAVAGVELEKDGHCVAAGTRVLTDKGSQKIEELVDNPPEFILTEFGPQPFMGVSCSGLRETYRVRTAFGNDVRVTEKHRFQVLQGDGSLTWKRVTELSSGDYLLCRRGDADMIPEDRGDSPELWEIIGNFYGDGSYNGNYLSWHIPDHELETLERIKEWFFAQGYWESTEEFPAYHGEKSFRVDCTVKPSGKLFYVLRSSHPRIFELVPPRQKKGRWRDAGFPLEIWKCGKEQMRAFIRGLVTTDGGGCVSNNAISFSTTRWRMARDFGLLMSYLGIVCNVGGRNIVKSEYTGKVSKRRVIYLRGSRSADIFLNEIGFGLRQKQDQLQFNLDSRKHKINFMGYHHAASLVNRIFPRRCQVSEKGKFNVNDTVTASIRSIRNGYVDGVSDSMLPAFIDRAEKLGHDDEALQHLKNYNDNGWWFDQVKKVSKSGECTVYDPVNVGTNSYVSNGIVSHNTIVEPHSKFINDNGNGWSNHVLLESYHSFILAENFAEHVSLPEFSKGKVLDAVAWVVERQYNGYREPVPTVFIDCLLATNKKKHPRLVSKMIKGLMNTVSMGCLLPDSLVTLADGTRRPVQEIMAGDYLLNGLGQVDRVRRVMVREVQDEPISHGKIRGIKDGFDLTGEHPVFMSWGDRDEVRFANFSKSALILPHQCGGPGVIPDYYRIDAVQEHKNSNSSFDPHVYIEEVYPRDIWIPSETVTEEDAELLGMLAGNGILKEGTADNSCTTVELHVNIAEWAGIARRGHDLMQYVCGQYNSYPHHASPEVEYLRSHDRDSFHFFRKFLSGRTAPEKRFSAEVIHWPLNLQRAVLRGYFNTDGDVSKTTQLKAESRSCDLIDQVYLMLIRQGSLATKTWVTHQPTGFSKGGSYRMYVVTIPASENESWMCDKLPPDKGKIYFNNQSFFRGSSVTRPIQEITKSLYNGLVYNLEMEGDPSYLINNIRIHNCDVLFTQCSKCGKVIEEGEDKVCEHIENQLGRYYESRDGKRHRVSELCGVRGKPGSCVFKELSLVAKPAFMLAKLHGFVDYGDESTGRPLKSTVPYSRYRESNKDI